MFAFVSFLNILLQFTFQIITMNAETLYAANDIATDEHEFCKQAFILLRSIPLLSHSHPTGFPYQYNVFMFTIFFFRIKGKISIAQFTSV